MGQALYRKYRSKSLDEIVGQSHITDMLRRSIAADRVAHAYRLTGASGVGKTSIARILAHEINELPYTDESIHLDIIEIDAASNNSVEDIRDLREKVQIAPTSARKKIYIIDEVHMLSKPAFNALLKTLEEPPAHIVFILATTDADKLPATIISRVQRFNFRLIHTDDAVKHLRMIADAEQIDIDDTALALIAYHGKGSFRDSIGLLDQLQNISDGAITSQLIEQVLGLADRAMVDELIAAHLAQNLEQIVSLIRDSERRGTPAAVLAEQLITTVRDRVLEQPELLLLLDRLLDISKSAWPQVKLLTALSAGTTMTEQLPQAISAESAPKKNKSRAIPTPVDVPPATSTTVSDTAEVALPAQAVAAAATVTTNSEPTEFSWQAFVDDIKQTLPGAGSLIAKLTHSLDGNQLTIYAGKKFTKTQLDKSRDTLMDVLRKTIPEGEIQILAASTPPSNSQTAAILDIMGGGEEVIL